jgi:hypothetical protein
MPVKRKRERHSFTILSTDEEIKQIEAQEPVESMESESNENQVKRVTDAPTNSKFYTDAQE